MTNQVIYQPKDTRFADLGGGIAQGVDNYLAGIQKQQDAENMAKALKGIGESPDYNTALQVIAASTNTVKDPAHLSLLFQAAREQHPAGEQDITETNAYDPITGAAHSFYVKRGEVDKLTDQNFVAAKTGTVPGALTTTKPNVATYVNPATGTDDKEYVVGMQPQGFITKDAFVRQAELVREKNAEAATGLAERRTQDTEAAQAETARHNRATEARQANVDNSDKDAKRVSTEQGRLKSYLATVHGAKVLQDGSLDLSSLDEPNKQEFIKEFDRGSALIEGGTAKTWGAAVRQLNKESKDTASKSANSGLPKGAKLGTVKTKAKDGTSVIEVLDASGKRIGWQPQ